MGGSPGAAGAFPPWLWPGLAGHGELISTTQVVGSTIKEMKLCPPLGGGADRDRMFGGFPPDPPGPSVVGLDWAFRGFPPYFNKFGGDFCGFTVWGAWPRDPGLSPLGVVS